MKSESILILVVAAAAAWYFFKDQITGTGDQQQSPTATPALRAYNTLSQIETRMRAQTNNGYALLTVAQWNGYLAQFSTVPTPGVFSDQSQRMNFYTYWASVKPYLQSSYGLTGIGWAA